MLRSTHDEIILRLTLPWPPSINNYYATFRGRRLISARGRAYARAVGRAILAHGKRCPTIQEKICISVFLNQPDRRKRDIDNTLKPLLDAMTKAGVYNDDSQIKRLYVDLIDKKRDKDKVEVDPGKEVHILISRWHPYPT